jgi:hypothetical protein
MWICRLQVFPPRRITFAYAIRKADGMNVVSPEYSNGLHNPPRR